MIPGNIKRTHILNALNDLQIAEIPKNRLSRKYALLYNRMPFPPKYVISLANKYANGTELDSEKFSGGQESNSFLTSRGFKVVTISHLPKLSKKLSVKKKKTIRKKRSHNERCPKCKEMIGSMLEKVYGSMERNYKVSLRTTPESFKDMSSYKDLKEIYKKLQEHRGHKDFVKIRTLPHCNFFVSNPGFILEFDESQHFTKPRELSWLVKEIDLKYGLLAKAGKGCKDD
jgi:hypothetical protein